VLLVVVVPAARLAAGLLVALSVTAIVSSPLSETSACRLAFALPRRDYASSPSQRASSASQTSLRSRT
jgi:hypothetical protein